MVRLPDGSVALDRTGRQAGRGAYLHASKDCVEAAQKRRSLDRSLGAAVPSEVWEQLPG